MNFLVITLDFQIIMILKLSKYSKNKKKLLMDEINIETNVGQGTVVTMAKSISA